ncbi:MAG TPA: DNA-processing protein DprA [Mycobacteriales bacterium]|nr:DNA-processing protein DprA [Mycobacteriales bacterium]
MTSGLTDAERAATATLLRIAEPGSPALARFVREHGVLAAVEAVRAGAAFGGMDVDALRHRLTHASGERDIERAQAVGARLVCPGDADWPAALEDLRWVDRDCIGVWARGPLRLPDVSERSVAIVGTRVATDYGAHVAAELAGGLAERGWAVVSGLAYGIDGVAHRAALASGGPTVAVLACGVDVPYPSGHRSLYERIVDEGLVITEHPPGAAPQRPRFLVRNRVIAALSLGTVVVEAALRSGARSTATHAGLLNRHLMVVPGPITSATSAGCHQLLRDRPDAVVVTRAEEIIEQCGHMGELAARVTGPATVRDALGPTVGRVFEGVPVRRASSVASIAATAGVSVEVAGAALAALAAAGLVEVTTGGWAMTTAGRSDRRARARPSTGELPYDDW